MTTQIFSDKLKKWYRHAIWNLRNRTFVLWFRIFGLVFVMVIASVIAWIIVLWYQLFYIPILTQVQIDEVRRQNAPVTFQKEQFQKEIKTQQARRDTIKASEPIIVPDIFYPTDYPRPKDNLPKF